MREIQGTPTYLLRLERSTWWGRPNQAPAALLSHRATQCSQGFSVSAQGHHPFVNLKACAALPPQLRARPKPRLQCMHMRQPPAASSPPAASDESESLHVRPWRPRVARQLYQRIHLRFYRDVRCLQPLSPCLPGCSPSSLSSPTMAAPIESTKGL